MRVKRCLQFIKVAANECELVSFVTRSDLLLPYLPDLKHRPCANKVPQLGGVFEPDIYITRLRMILETTFYISFVSSYLDPYGSKTCVSPVEFKTRSPKEKMRFSNSIGSSQAKLQYGASPDVHRKSQFKQA